MKRLCHSLAGALLLGCADSPAGPDNSGDRDLTLTICESSFEWVGYRNEGGSWRQVTDAGEVTLRVTEKVSLAFQLAGFGAMVTSVLNASAAELQGASLLRCDMFGERIINGSISSPLDANDEVQIAGSTSIVFADAANILWSLEGLPGAGTIDLVAALYESPFSVVQRPERVIVRRGIVPNPSGTPIAPLDFFGQEGLAPQLDAVSTQIVAGASYDVSSGILTDNGTILDLSSTSLSPGLVDGPPGTMLSFEYASLSASQRVSSDTYFLEITVGTETASHDVLHFFRTPGGKSFTHLPEVNPASVAPVATSPYLRLRATVAAQPELPAAMSVNFYQASSASPFRVVSITTTAGFAGGTPSTWAMEIPDFGNSGYQSAWGLPNAPYQVDVTGYNGDLGAFLGHIPADGATLRSSTRFGTSGGGRANASTIGALALSRRPLRPTTPR